MSNSPNDPNSPLFPWYRPPVTPAPARPALSSLLATAQPRPSLFGSLLTGLIRARIFVSYQHSTDQYYYNEFSRIFHDTYECVYDNSLDDEIDSNDHAYIKQRIRAEFITGTSCTIVLVGPTTYQRKHIDWEIKATLDKEHGLIGIHLPHLPRRLDGLFTVPLRFAENVRSGYALWVHWDALVAEPHALPQLIESACSRPKERIVNPHEIKKENG